MGLFFCFSGPSWLLRTAQREPDHSCGPRTVVVTGPLSPFLCPIEPHGRFLRPEEKALLYNSWVDYLHLDPSVDLKQRGADSVQADFHRGASFGQSLCS